MRAAFIVSAVLHLTILAAAIMQFGSTKSFSTAAVVALPVDLVTIAEETDLTIGEVEAEEVVENAAPETVEAPEPPQPDEAPGATGEADETIATDADARANAPESSAPAPEAEPEPQETEVAEAEPEAPPPPPPAETAEPEPEAPAETEVAALDPQEVTPPAAEPEPTPPAPQPETVVPSRKPPPPPRRAQTPPAPQQQTPDTFNADRLSQLINRTDPTGGGSGSSDASLGSADGRNAAQLTLSEMDALRSQMQRCWTPPIGLANAQALVVTVQIRLAIDGSVVSIERVGAQSPDPLFEVAADAARRAVLQCQPYRLPSAKYESWKDVQVNFDPRDLF